MKNKVKLIGLAITILATVVIGQALGVNINTKNGGIYLIPIVYLLTVYGLPYAVRDFLNEFHDDINICITKSQRIKRRFEENIGAEVEEIEIELKGELIE
jgi:hypothetical protein